MVLHLSQLLKQLCYAADAHIAQSTAAGNSAIIGPQHTLVYS